MNRYVIYSNGSGTHAYWLGDVDTAENEYRRLIKDNYDDYDYVNAIYVEIEDNRIIETWELILPEFNED
jgi:hypothetical protein